MDPQSDPLLALLSELVVWLDNKEAAIDDAAISRGVELLFAYKEETPSFLWKALLVMPAHEILNTLARTEPSLKELPVYSEWAGWRYFWNPKAIEYVAKLQAALKEKKENG